MFESKIETKDKPKYLKIGPYIISLDQIHGVMSMLSENKQFPWHIYITYMDKSTVVLEIPTKEENEKACDKIANALGAI